VTICSGDKQIVVRFLMPAVCVNRGKMPKVTSA
jgi:hypothetical protein